jgi:hypothetical protein
MCTRTTHVGQRTRVHWGEPNWVCSILALHLRDVYLLGKCCMLHDILPQPDRTNESTLRSTGLTSCLPLRHSTCHLVVAVGSPLQVNHFPLLAHVVYIAQRRSGTMTFPKSLALIVLFVNHDQRQHRLHRRPSRFQLVLRLLQPTSNLIDAHMRWPFPPDRLARPTVAHSNLQRFLPLQV